MNRFAAMIIMPMVVFILTPGPTVIGVEYIGWDRDSNTIAATAPNAPTEYIGAWTQRARPGQTVAVLGYFANDATFRFSDGTSEADGTVLRHEGTTCSLVVVPDSLGTGTLWLWVADGANSVTINSPKVWWAYPNKPAIGDDVRIFGRSIGEFSSPTAKVVLKNTSSGTTYSYTATVLSDESASIAVTLNDDNGSTISNGTYRVYFDEWKSGGLWNGLDYTGDALDGSTITLQAAYAIPAGTVSVASYGAAVDDGISDTEAIQSAINAADSANSGTVTFEAGTYKVNQGNGTHANLLTLKSGVHLKGAGVGSTILEFSWDNPSTYSSSVCMKLDKFDMSVSSMTLKVIGNNFPNNKKIFQTKGADLSYKNSCYNIILQNLALDGRGTSLAVPCGDFHGWYNTVDNVEIWGLGSFALVGRQLRLNNIRHHGSRGMHKYTGISPQIFSPQLAESLGGREILIENCTAGSDNWDTEYGIVRRFFSSNDGYGGINHIAIIDNTVNESLTSPWAGTGENIHNETGRSILWRGTGCIFNGTQVLLPTPMAGIAIPQFNGMPIVAVTAGKGFGQTRIAWQWNTTNMIMDSPFTVTPDAGSVITIAYAWYECLVSGNTLTNGAKYGEASVGVQHWMKAVGCVTSNNTISGFATGYLDSAMTTASGIIGFSWWGDVHDNTINDCLVGIYSFMTEGQKAFGMLLGNGYRNNTISNMDLSLPQWQLHTTHTALAINDSAWHKSGASSGVVCSIYENNVVTEASRGFACDMFAWMPVLRNNRFTSITERCYDVSINSSNWHEADTSSNSMPRLFVNQVSSGERARQVFGLYHPTAAYRYPRQLERAIYVWSEDSAGSISTTTWDADGDSATYSAASGLTANAHGDFSWSGLTTGVQELMAFVNDGTETASVPVTIYSGGLYDPMTELTITEVDADTSEIVSTVRTYRLDVVEDLAAGAYSNPSEVNLGLTEGTTETKILLNKRRVLFYPTTSTLTGYVTAAVSFTTNFYTYSSGILTVRLKESSDRYYEFIDHVAANDYNQTFNNYARRIRRIYDGAVTDDVSSLAAHLCEGPVLCYAKNGDVIFDAWGHRMHMADASPLSVKTYEIELSVGGTASSNNYRTIDDLWTSDP